MQMTYQPWLICNHIWHPARRLRLTTTLIDSTTLKWLRPHQSLHADTTAADVRSPPPAPSANQRFWCHGASIKGGEIANNARGCRNMAEDRSEHRLERAARRLRGTVPRNNWARAALKRRESINNQTKPEDMFLQHLGILPQQIMQTSSGNSLPICM